MRPETARWILEALAPLTVNVVAPDAAYHASMAAQAVADLTAISEGAGQ